MGGRAGKYIKAVLSCLFFDMGDRQGRHAWADLMTIVIALGVYRHAYAPQFPLLSWLEGGQWVGFLATGVAWEATTFDYNLISPLSTSVLLGTVLVSMAAGSPFTEQYARLNERRDSRFQGVPRHEPRANRDLWAIVFSIMTACSLMRKDFVGTQGPARDSRETYPEKYVRYAFPGRPGC